MLLEELLQAAEIRYCQLEVVLIASQAKLQPDQPFLGFRYLHLVVRISEEARMKEELVIQGEPIAIYFTAMDKRIRIGASI